MNLSLLVDNDVVIKLARMGCFAEGIAAIGRSPGEVGSIKVMLRFMGIIDGDRRRRLCANEQEADRLQAALTTLTAVEMSAAESATAAALMAAALEAGLDFDEGEAMLLAVAISRNELEVATGDKRALRALPELEAAAPSIAVVRRRLICLEQIFVFLTKKHGVRYVNRAVASCPRADEAISYVNDNYGSKDATLISALGHLIRQQITEHAPGWLNDC